MQTESKLHNRVDDVIDKIAPFMAGHDPRVQGAVIAQMFAIYLLGRQGPDKEEVRRAVFDIWLDMVSDLLKIFEEKAQNFSKKNQKIN